MAESDESNINLIEDLNRWSGNTRDFSDALGMLTRQFEDNASSFVSFNKVMRTQVNIEREAISKRKEGLALKRSELRGMQALIPTLNASYKMEKQRIKALEESTKALNRQTIQGKLYYAVIDKVTAKTKEFGEGIKNSAASAAKSISNLVLKTGPMAALGTAVGAVSMAVGKLIKDFLELNSSLANSSKSFGVTRSQLEGYGKVLTNIREQYGAFGISIKDVAEAQNALIESFRTLNAGKNEGLVKSATLLSKIGLSAGEASELIAALNMESNISGEKMSDSLLSMAGMLTKSTPTAMVFRDLATSAFRLSSRTEESLKNLTKMSEYAVRTGQSTDELIDFADSFVIDEQQWVRMSRVQGEMQSRLGKTTLNFESMRQKIIEYQRTGIGAQEIQEEMLKQFDIMDDYFSNTKGVEWTTGMRKDFEAMFGKPLQDIRRMSVLQKQLKKDLDEYGRSVPRTWQDLLGSGSTLRQQLSNVFDAPFAKMAGGAIEIEEGLSSWLRSLQYSISELTPTFDQLKSIFKLHGGGGAGLAAAAQAFIKPIWTFFQDDVIAIMEVVWQKMKPFIDDLVTYMGQEIRVILYEATKDSAMPTLGSSREQIEKEKLVKKAENLGLSSTYEKEAPASYDPRQGGEYLDTRLVRDGRGGAKQIITREKSVPLLKKEIELEEQRLNILKLINETQTFLKPGADISFGGANALGGVYNRPTLAMIGEEGRDEVVIPTGRIREGLPINSAVASQLRSIGVPGFYGGAWAARAQNRGIYAQAGDPASIRKRDADMRRVNEDYQEGLKRQHREIFKKEMELIRYQGRNNRNFGRHIGMFGKYTRALTTRMRNLYKPGTIEDAFATGLAKYFETGKWQDGIRAGFDTAMKDNGFIYENIKESTNNVVAETTQGAYNAFRRWEEGGMEGGLKEGARLTALGGVRSLRRTRFDEGEWKGYTFAGRLAAQLTGSGPKSKELTQQEKTTAVTVEIVKEVQSLKAQNLETAQAEYSQRENNTNILKNTIDENGARNADVITSLAKAVANQPAPVVNITVAGQPGVAPTVPAAVPAAIPSPATVGNPPTPSEPATISSGPRLRANGGSYPAGSGSGIGMFDSGSGLGSGLINPAQTNVPFNGGKFLGSDGNPIKLGSKPSVGSSPPTTSPAGNPGGTGEPSTAAGKFGSFASKENFARMGIESAMSGLEVGLQTGSFSKGAKAAASSFESMALSGAMAAGPYGMAAAGIYMAGKSLFQWNKRRIQKKKDKKYGAKSASDYFKVGGAFHRGLKRTGTLPGEIPLDPPQDRGKHAYNSYMKVAEKGIKASITDVFGDYIDSEQIQDITDTYIKYGGMDSGTLEGFMSMILENAGKAGARTKVNAAGKRVLVTGSSPSGGGGMGQIGQSSNMSVQSLNYNRGNNLGGGITSNNVNERSYNSYMQGAGVMGNNQFNEKFLSEVKRIADGTNNKSIYLDSKPIGEMLESNSYYRSAGIPTT